MARPPLSGRWRLLRLEVVRLAPLLAAVGTGVLVAVASAVNRSTQALARSLPGRVTAGGAMADHWSHRVATSSWRLAGRAARLLEQPVSRFDRLAMRADAAMLRRMSGSR